MLLLCPRVSAHSLVPTDSGCGYRQPKARLGRKHVRAWKWMDFTNPAREVGGERECAHLTHGIPIGWSGIKTLA